METKCNKCGFIIVGVKGKPEQYKKCASCDWKNKFATNFDKESN